MNLSCDGFRDLYVCSLVKIHLNNTEIISVRTAFIKSKENTYSPNNFCTRFSMESFEGSENVRSPCQEVLDEKTHHKDDLWTESRAMQEMLVDICRLSVEFSPQSTRVSIILICNSN
jgi:hypothetical protein